MKNKKIITEQTEPILKELKSLYNVLDLMINGIISKELKTDLINNINILLKQLNDLTNNL